MTGDQTRPKLKRIVCAYDLGALPTWWLMVHRSIKTRLERAGAGVRVDVLPLSALPADVDLIVVAPELLPAARDAAAETECVTIAPENYAGEAFRLLTRLRDEERFEMKDPAELTADEPIIARWVGYERAD